MQFLAIRGSNLTNLPKLRNQMFAARRVQFVEKLGWDLCVDNDGYEQDEYDRQNPIYLMVLNDEGDHIASSRLMPTINDHMAVSHFSKLFNGQPIRSHLIWETSRFFVSKKACNRTAPALMWAGCELAELLGIKQYLSVTGRHLVRVFSACGWRPTVIGTGNSAEGEICACLWDVNGEQKARVARNAGLGKLPHFSNLSILPVGTERRLTSPNTSLAA